MISNSPVISNPTLYYKLDPGEMGIAAPAKASESVLRVAAHELGNIHRFEAKAKEEGGIVIYENIFLNRQFTGSFLAARSGESKVLIIYPKKHLKVSFSPTSNKDSSTSETTKQQIKKLQRRLQEEIIYLQAKLRNTENNPEQHQKAQAIREKIRNIKSLLLRLSLAENRPNFIKSIGPLPVITGSEFDRIV